MSNAWVLMTAMPPTKGHKHLIEFAAALNVNAVNVIVCTQPSEPMWRERYNAIHNEFKDYPRVCVTELHRVLEQNPQAPGFWDMWVKIMHNFGARPGDVYVSSEMYGANLAALLDGRFMPYDPKRELYYVKATNVRSNPAKYFDDIMDSFQPHLTRTVTIFGAESTGKTTLSLDLSKRMNGQWLFEWARPYLENVGSEVTVQAMSDIWRGQMATQVHAKNWTGKPWIIQDTDLFSTIGYWDMPAHPELGDAPKDLIYDAKQFKSDLYIITKSNIAFEQDPLRYGGDKRETSDQYWIDLCEQYDLNYVVLESETPVGRAQEAAHHMYDLWDETVTGLLTYERKFNG